MEDSNLLSLNSMNIKTFSGDPSMHLLAQNRRQLVYGPPANYHGPRPPMSCELYVTNLPASLNVSAFLQWLKRLGDVYEMRIMMNTVSETRGYCFVRFFERKAAIAAFELLTFLFLRGKRPNAQMSQCKRQLFIGNIPKSLSVSAVQTGFKKLFGGVTDCVVYPQKEFLNSGGSNRGFAFLKFIEHDAALEAKKFLKYHRLWGQFIRVDWAKQNETKESLTMRVSDQMEIRKNDYSAKLRLYALANNWCIPVIVYGSNFRQHGVQYGGVLLKSASTGDFSCIIVEVVGNSYDIHILICEVATHLIEVFCGLPQKHFIVRTRYGATAKILYSFTDALEISGTKFSPSSLVSAASAFELLTSLQIIAQYTSATILQYYKNSFQIKNFGHMAKFALIEGLQLSHFYSIYPKFRDNYPLNNNFNDMEITLLQATAVSNDTVIMTQEVFDALITAKAPDEGAFMLKSQRFNRHPNYVLHYVDVKMLTTCAFYSPLQQLNTPPLWVRGKTYQESIYESFEISAVGS